MSKADRAAAIDALMRIAARRQRGELVWLDAVPPSLIDICCDAYKTAKGDEYGRYPPTAHDYAAAASLLDAGWEP